MRKIILSVLILLCGEISYGQKNEISLLNGRFFCTFPDSAKNIARATDIMAADPNENNETRVFYDIGEKRIVFFAEELYLKGTNNLENRLREESTKDFPLSVETIFNKDSVLCIRMTPAKFDTAQSAIFVNSLVIKNADNTLSKLSVFLNPNAFSDKATFDRLTEQVFSSFKKGIRKLKLGARTETVHVLNSKTTMQLSLPKDYMLSVDKKFDFEVYNIRKVTMYGDTMRADLTIYLGFYPSLFNSEFELQKFKKADTNGEFLLQKMKWLNFNDESRNLILREQIIPDDRIQENAQIHIAMISNNQKLIEELTAIVQKINLNHVK